MVFFSGQTSNADLVGKNHAAVHNSNSSAGIPSSEVNFYPTSYSKLHFALPSISARSWSERNLQWIMLVRSSISPCNNKYGDPAYTTHTSSFQISLVFEWVIYLQRVTEGKIEGGIEVTGRQGRRRRKLLDDLKERRGYCHLKEEAPDLTMWRARFGRGVGPVVRQTTKWMNESHWFLLACFLGWHFNAAECRRVLCW